MTKKELDNLDSIIYDVFNIPKEVILSDHEIQWLDYYDGEMAGLKFDNSIITFVDHESYKAVVTLPDNQAGGLSFSFFTFNPLIFEFEFNIEKDSPDDEWLILDRIDSQTIDTIYSGSDTLFAGYFESMEPVKFEFISPNGDSKYIVVNPHSGFKLNDKEFQVPMKINLGSEAQNFGRTLQLRYGREAKDFIWEFLEEGDWSEALNQRSREIFNSDFSNGIRKLYCGSAKPANAAELFSQPDVDGGLIGGASLKVDDFLGVVEAAG